MKTLEQLGISQTPWRINDHASVLDRYSAIISGQYGPYDWHNARLIAAAPELYESLRVYQEAFEEIRKSALFLDANFHEIMNLNKVMTAAEAALAKASGEREAKE